MKMQYLVNAWELPDNTRLTAKQVSLRFPVHVAAKIAALCEMYPRQNRTQIIGDLLTWALQEMEQSFPFVPGEAVTRDENDRTLYRDQGPGARFRELANKHYQELETELGNPDAPALYPREVWEHDPDEEGL